MSYGDEYSFFGPTGADMWAANPDLDWDGPDTSWMWNGSQGFDYFNPTPDFDEVWSAAGFTEEDLYGLPGNPYFASAAQEVYALQSGNLWTGSGYLSTNQGYIPLPGNTGIQTEYGVFQRTNAAWEDYLEG